MPTEQKPKHFRKSLIAVGGVLLLCVLVCLFFLSNLVNNYLEMRITKEFNKKYAPYSLKISGLNYNILKNRLGCDSLVLTSDDPGFSCNIGTSSVSGIGWMRLIWNSKHKKNILLGAVVDAQDVLVKFRNSYYGVSCRRLHLSMSGGEITADDVSFKPYVDDKHFFAGKKYRTTRYRINIPRCTVTGLAIPELLKRTMYQVRSVQFNDLSLDALVNKYVSVDPGISNGRMPNEMLNSLNKKVRIESLNVVNGNIKYGEIYANGAKTATVTFDKMQLQAEGIANHGKRDDTAHIYVQTEFMRAAVMKMDIIIPLSSKEFNFTYSGSLNAMEINRLNPFLEHSEYMRIDSGLIKSIMFDIRVAAGHATGSLEANYKDLKIAFLNKKTGSSDGIINRIASWFSGQFKIRGENIPDKKRPKSIGKVEYTRNPKNSFIQFLWLSVRSGILDVLLTKDN